MSTGHPVGVATPALDRLICPSHPLTTSTANERLVEHFIYVIPLSKHVDTRPSQGAPKNVISHAKVASRKLHV